MAFPVLIAFLVLVITLFAFLFPGLADSLVELFNGSPAAVPELTGDRIPAAATLPESESELNSETSPPRGEIEVFLSFRGADTRNHFTDCLYTSLKDAGIRVFLDSEDLRTGDEIGTELRRGIEQSKICILVLSKGYASSTWCLREISYIAECNRRRKRMVMPIFFDVTPDQVKDQNGKYDEELRKHAKKYPHSVEEWRKALSELGRLKGLVLEDMNDGKWGQFIKSVVKRALCELKKAYLPMNKTFVGIDRHVGAVMDMLDVGVGDVKVVGIYGVVGIGKTTLAKNIYNELLNRSDFEGWSSLDGIREKSQLPNGLQLLQSKLVTDITRIQHDFGSVDEGTNVLMDRFHEKKVLILLDDVDNHKQLNALVGEHEWFGPGSRIIITTMDGSILREAPQVNGYYEMEGMKHSEALELFNKHAFRTGDAPTEPSMAELNVLANDIVEAAEGLPLAVEIIGSHLCGRDKDMWKATLKQLRKEHREDVLGKLRVSYEALDKEERQIFLDIACFFIGMDKRVVFHMWKGCDLNPILGIEVLQLRSLVKIGEDNKLWMHNYIRDLGRAIVEKESGELAKRSRLWCKEASKVLQNNKGTEYIKGISLQCESSREFYNGEQFRNMSNLSFLRLGNADLTGDIRPLSELRWLSLPKSSLNFKAESLRLENLKVLDLSGSLVKEDWSAWSSTKKFAKLKVLDLSGCQQLTKTPNLSMFKKLDRLILENCQRLSAFQSLGDLKCLSSLNLKGCLKIRKLPDGLGSLEKLTELIIDGTYIEQLPDSIGALKNLQRLSANDCQRLQELPDTIGQLSSLVKLSLSHTGLATLPDSVGNLSNLEVLDLISSDICRFPSALGKLTKLREINASKCKNLKDLPDELGMLSSLKVLRLDGTSIKGIADTIHSLSRLQTLHLMGCKKLQSLPELPISLVSLRATCQFTKPIPNLTNLVNLVELVLSINTKHCEVSSLNRLKVLSLASCKRLESISEFPGSLLKLRISDCSLEKLPDLSNLGNLSGLSIENCNKLTGTGLSGLEGLKSLNILNVSSCEKLTSLPNLSMLKKLYVVKVRGCEGLAEICGLENLYALNDLDIGKCSSLRTLPDLSNLKLLRSLSADGCKKLRELKGLGNLVGSLSIRISGCRDIKCLPNVSKLKKLRHLDIAGCDNISKVEGLLELKSLERIVISRHVSIAKLRDLPKEREANFLDQENSSFVSQIIAKCHSRMMDSRGIWSDPGGDKSESIGGIAVSISEGNVIAIYPYDGNRNIQSVPKYLS